MHVSLIQLAVEQLHVTTTAVNILLVLNSELDDKRLVHIGEGLELRRKGVKLGILACLDTLVKLGIQIYTYVMVTFLKKETTNPIAKIAGCELTIPADRVNDYASRGTEKVNCAIKELRRLFLVENW